LLANLVSNLLTFFGKNINIILQLLLIAVLTLFVNRLINISGKNIERRIIEKRIDAGQQSRLKTLLRAGTGTLNVIVIIIAILMALLVVGIEITPLLASVGVAGLAVSLGAQTLIKDYIGGIIILFENQFNVGDDIEVGNVIGTVERIELRATYVRDVQGRLFIIPNGEVRILSNNSREWRNALVDLNLAFGTDFAKAIEALRMAVEQAAEDETLKSILLDLPRIQGWTSMNDWSVQVRLSAKTIAGKQLIAAVALRRVALQALDEAGIRLAVPPTATRS
jgi:small conductance mechanosensitive channel